jgi:hypothetical protein
MTATASLHLPTLRDTCPSFEGCGWNMTHQVPGKRT